MTAINITEIAEAICTDFEAFCRYCLTTTSRDWRVAPEKSEIKDIPFILAEHQREFIAYLERTDISDKVVLKCRQRGYSTVMIAYILWKLLYSYNENIIYSIHKGDEATKMASMLRRMYDSIPEIFRPATIEWRVQPSRAFNRRRNNFIMIKTATPDTGRSGTYTMVICDEVDSYEEICKKEISASLTASCPKNRIWISTPKCEDSIFHEKVKEAEAGGYLWQHSYWEYIDDWFGSKENAERWRVELIKGLTPAQVNKEYFCLFKGAAEDLIWYVEPSMYRRYHGRPNQRVVVALDLGWSDDTAILFAKDYGQVLHIFDEIIVSKTTIPEVASLIKQRGYLLQYGVMDSSGKKTDMTSGVSAWKQMQRLLGCRFYTKKLNDKIEMLRIANSAILQNRVFVDMESCPQLVKMFNNYEWKNDSIPHDKYSHIHDSLCYLIYNWARRPGKELRPKFEDRSKYGIY